MADGLLDTNVFLHAQANDDLSEECRRFLSAVEQGQVRARLEPVVLHELSYVLTRFLKQMTRQRVAEYLVTVLRWPGVTGDKVSMVAAVERWRDTPGLGFADAYFAALAAELACPVYTKNVHDLTSQGIEVPNPLPSTAP